MQSINENAFECFANTGVNSPETMFRILGYARFDIPKSDFAFPIAVSGHRVTFG